MEGSVRINLSVPAKIDRVLSGLAEATGASKASFVMQALNWYLPQLQGKLREFGKADRSEGPAPFAEQGEALHPAPAAPTPTPAPAVVKLSRAERRRAEREARKAGR